MNYDIFLSYKSKDNPKAKIIAEALEQKGYSVFLERKIPVGRVFDEYIQEKLNEAKCVIVLWSNESVISDWIREEAKMGMNKGILIPVLIEEVKPPIGFSNIQVAQLIDWEGELPNPEFDLLAESIRQIIVGQIEQKKQVNLSHFSARIQDRQIIVGQAEQKKPRAKEKTKVQTEEMKTSNVDKTDDKTGFFFISYSRDDKKVVDKLIERLKETNHKVWIDTEGIQGGARWRQKIVEAIEGSIAFIIVLSPNSIKSENVRKELDLADNKKIIPIDIESITLPSGFKYPLAGLQRIDFASDFESGFTQLEVALQTSP
jgi:hypothetical protein